jgi:hypothetical protein
MNFRNADPGFVELIHQRSWKQKKGRDNPNQETINK